MWLTTTDTPGHEINTPSPHPRGSESHQGAAPRITCRASLAPSDGGDCSPQHSCPLGMRLLPKSPRGAAHYPVSELSELSLAFLLSPRGSLPSSFPRPTPEVTPPRGQRDSCFSNSSPLRGGHGSRRRGLRGRGRAPPVARRLFPGVAAGLPELPGGVATGTRRRRGDPWCP